MKQGQWKRFSSHTVILFDCIVVVKPAVREQVLGCLVQSLALILTGYVILTGLLTLSVLQFLHFNQCLSHRVVRNKFVLMKILEWFLVSTECCISLRYNDFKATLVLSKVIYHWSNVKHIPKYKFLEMDLEIKEQEPQLPDHDICLSEFVSRPSTVYISVCNISLFVAFTNPDNGSFANICIDWWISWCG